MIRYDTLRGNTRIYKVPLSILSGGSVFSLRAHLMAERKIKIQNIKIQSRRLIGYATQALLTSFSAPTLPLYDIR